jgi:hypothetical protein
MSIFFFFLTINAELSQKIENDDRIKNDMLEYAPASSLPCLKSSLKTVGDIETACVCKAYEFYYGTIKYSKWCDSTANILQIMKNSKNHFFSTPAIRLDRDTIVPANTTINYYSWANHGVPSTENSLFLDCECRLHLKDDAESNDTAAPAPKDSPFPQSAIRQNVVEEMGDGLATDLGVVFAVSAFFALALCAVYSLRCGRKPATTREEDAANNLDALLISPAPFGPGITSTPPEGTGNKTKPSTEHVDEDFIMLSSGATTIIEPFEKEKPPENAFSKRVYNFLGIGKRSEEEEAHLESSNPFVTNSEDRWESAAEEPKKKQEEEFTQISLDSKNNVLEGLSKEKESTETITDVYYNSGDGSDSFTDPFGAESV